MHAADVRQFTRAERSCVVHRRRRRCICAIELIKIWVIHCVHLGDQWVANGNDSMFILSTPLFF
jgi:hypothetical protein